ncbi:MAG: GlgB N-terminal domain-containing protein [Lachnospiraceae bacterium]
MADLFELMDWPGIEAIVYSEEQYPREILGPHVTKHGLLVQCFFPKAKAVDLLLDDSGKRIAMQCQDEAGFFVCLLKRKKKISYHYEVHYADAPSCLYPDPYAFPAQYTAKELQQFDAGIFYNLYSKMGAHPMTVGTTKGIYFSVWVPTARRVSVRLKHSGLSNEEEVTFLMDRISSSGIYDLFIPGLEAGVKYYFEILLRGSEVQKKADPYAQRRVTEDSIYSLVPVSDAFAWADHDWIQMRGKSDTLSAPLAICETELAHFCDEESVLKYSQIAEKIVKYASEFGYTHVELAPVMEFLDDTTRGYATCGYFAPTSRYGTPEEFKQFVNLLHQAGLGVVMDWTAAHFPETEGGLQNFGGRALYEEPDSSKSYHPLWNTRFFNYADKHVKNFLLTNAFYWVQEYHIDGLRLDDVDSMLYLDYARSPGEWSPNMYGGNENLAAVEFLKHLNSIMGKKKPDVMIIAQEDGYWPHLTGEVDSQTIGFTYKWNRGWTESILQYFSVPLLERSAQYEELTLSMVYAYYENFILTLGIRDIEDLAVFAKRFEEDEPAKGSTLRLLTGYQFTHPGKKMLPFTATLESEQQTYLSELLQLYKTHPALYSLDTSAEGFEWLVHMPAEYNIVSFLRQSENVEDTLLVVCNFSAAPCEEYTLGVPFDGKYKEILNSDHTRYGGSGYINPRIKTVREQETNGRQYTLRMKIAGMSIAIFRYVQKN